MQSSNIFTVGGSLSVNAHGRDPNYGPIIQTVRSFRLLLADGNIVSASRTERPELFRLVIGGFGLFGVILDVDLSLTENIIFRKSTELLGYKTYPEYFAKTVKGRPAVGLHYARLSSAREGFLEELYATTYTADQPTGKDLSALDQLDEDEPVVMPRLFFGWARHADWGKRLNWYMLKTFVDAPGKKEWISRNNAMRPVGRFVEFVDGTRELFRRHGVNLLNVTLRYVPANQEAFLSYARRDSFAFVFYINQGLSPQGIAAAQSWTRELVDLCLHQGGTYFLPYQLYPTSEQLRRSYPDASAFFAKKREYDPDSRFMSKFYAWYGMRN
jgi:FAD/FMN-containing dehydrogenase